MPSLTTPGEAHGRHASSVPPETARRQAEKRPGHDSVVEEKSSNGLCVDFPGEFAAPVTRALP